MALLFRDTMLAMRDDAQCLVARTKEVRQRAVAKHEQQQCTDVAHELAALTYQFVSHELFAHGDLETMARALIALHLHSGVDADVWPLVHELAPHQALLDGGGPLLEWRAAEAPADARPPHVLSAEFWSALFSCMTVSMTRLIKADQCVEFSGPGCKTTVPMYTYVPFWLHASAMGVRANAIAALFLVKHTLAPHKNYADVLHTPLFAHLSELQREDVLGFLRVGTHADDVSDTQQRLALRDDLATLLRHSRFHFPSKITLTPDLPASYAQPESETPASSGATVPETQSAQAGITQLVGTTRQHDVSGAALLVSFATTTTQKQATATPLRDALRVHLTPEQRARLFANPAVRTYVAQHALPALTTVNAPIAARYLVANLLGHSGTSVASVRSALGEHYQMPARVDTLLRERSVLHSNVADAAHWHALLSSAYAPHDGSLLLVDAEHVPELAPVLALNNALPQNERATSATQRLRRYMTVCVTNDDEWKRTWRAAWPLSAEAERALDAFRALNTPVPAATAQALVHAVGH